MNRFLGLGLMALALAAVSPLASQEPVETALLTWVHGELSNLVNGANTSDACRNGATKALSGLNRSDSWWWAVDVTDDDGQEVLGITYLTSPDLEAKWDSAGRTDATWPGGEETLLSKSGLGNLLPDSITWQIPRSTRLVIVVGHEALHWLPGYGEEHTEVGFSDFEECWVMGEEEDDDGDDDGGGSDPEPTTTCTDSKEWVPPVTMRVWVKPESTMGESGPPVDLDHEVGAHLPGIVINVESGYWKEVVVSDGYYRTVTTCTTG